MRSLPSPPVSPPGGVTPEVKTSPHIWLRKRALAHTVPAGSTVKYRLVVTAVGGTVQGLVVCDDLPANMTFVSLGSATLESGNACWHIGTLTGSKTLFLTVKVDTDAPTGTITNNATATSTNAGGAKAHANVKVPAKHGVEGALKRTAGVTG